jgi:Bacterial tandem repeat domain 1
MYWIVLLILKSFLFLPILARPSFTADYISTTATGSQDVLINWEPELFGNQVNWYFSQNYRLETARTYINGTIRKWAGQFAPGTDGQYFYFGMQDYVLQDRDNLQFKNKGWALTNLETYEDGGQRYWAAIWRTGETGLWNISMTADMFGNLFKERLDSGYRLIDFTTYVDKGNRLWAGVWKAGTDGQYLFWGMDETMFHDKVGYYWDQGYTLTSVTTYNDDGIKYGAAWRNGVQRTANYINTGLDSQTLYDLSRTHREKDSLALSTFAVLPCSRPTFTFSLDLVRIAEIRSHGSDTLYISASLAIPGRAPYIESKYYGDKHSGDSFNADIVFSNIPLGADEVAVFSYIIANNGHSQNTIVNDLEKGLFALGQKAASKVAELGIAAAGAALGAEIGTGIVPFIGTAIGAAVGFLVGTIGDYFLKDCDGVVAAGIHPFTGQDLCTSFDAVSSLSKTESHFGESVCGDGSIYFTTYSVRY